LLMERALWRPTLSLDLHEKLKVAISTAQVPLNYA